MAIREKLDRAKQHQEKVESLVSGWDDPVPISTAEERVPEFPLEVLPTPLADCARLIAEATAGHLDYVCTSMLAVVSGLIGDRAIVRVKNGFDVSAPMWLALVGRSGVNKSPPLFAVSKRVREINREQVERYPQPPEKYPLGEGEFLLSIVQMETLLRLLKRQSLGSLMILDELRAWVRSWDQYRSGDKGQDRQQALQLFDGHPIAVHRSNYTLHLDRPRLGVVGAIQPDSLREIFVGSGDGLPPRFLWCFPDRVTVIGEQWRELDDAAMRPWHQVVDLVRSIPLMTEIGDEAINPIVFSLAQSARGAWGEMTDHYAQQMNDSRNSAAYIECLSKLRGGYAAKLALSIKVIHQCFRSAPETLGEEDIHRARWVVDYFAAHARKVLGVSGIDPRNVPARTILSWLHRKQVETFNTASCYRELRRVFSKPEETYQPLSLLEKLNIIKRVETVQEMLSRGRPPSTSYKVHPHVADEQKVKELLGD
jgi:hypothetical protein